MSETARNRFVLESERRLRGMYRAISEGLQYSDTERTLLTGFMQAGIFLGLTTKAELNELVAQIHLEELGETIEERRKRKGKQWPGDQPDFSEYDAPTYERVKRK